MSAAFAVVDEVRWRAMQHQALAAITASFYPHVVRQYLKRHRPATPVVEHEGFDHVVTPHSLLAMSNPAAPRRKLFPFNLSLTNQIILGLVLGIFTGLFFMNTPPPYKLSVMHLFACAMMILPYIVCSLWPILVACNKTRHE